jgi:hypothetical protein
LAARNSFTSGTLLSLEDNYDVSAQQKLRVNCDGLVWAAGGADLSSSEVLHMPTGGTLPTGLGASDEGRQFYKTGTSSGFYIWDGSAWALKGGTWEGYMDAASDYLYTQLASPVEEVVGQFVFDGSKVPAGLAAKFRAIMTPTLSVAGDADCKLYDLGAVGSPAAPRLVSTLRLTTSGVAYVEQALTVSATPSTNQILDAACMYEIVLYESSTVGDTIYLGSAGINIEI